MEHPAQALPIGVVLRGQYRIESVLGKGGFGITYLAHDVDLDLQVAVKEYLPTDFVSRDDTHTVHPHTAKNTAIFERFRDRFLHEAQTLAQINQANVVQVKTLFREYNTVYLVMEFIEGVTLSA